MWSFGSKRADHTQSDGNNQHQTAPNRSNTSGDPEIDQHQHQHQPQHQHHHRQLSPKSGVSRMFYKNKKSISSSNNASSNTKSNPRTPGSGIQPRTPQQDIRKKRYFGGGSNNRRKSVSNSDDECLPDVSVNETSNGIEVSFPGSESFAVSAPGNKGKIERADSSSVTNRVSVQTPVISLKDQIRERQLVLKGHFSTVLPASNNDSFSAINTKKWKPKGHRIPLLRITSADAGYSNTLHLLKSMPIADERTAVRQELNLMETEISCLERDRIWLEQSLHSTSSNSGKTNRGSDSDSLNKENIVVTWDAHKLLKNDAMKQQPLSMSERDALQKQRGNSLTIHLSNNQTQERFVLAFGGKQNNLRTTYLFRDDESIMTIAPNNNSSIDAGATTLQHLSLISSASNGGLYFSQDLGKSQSIGQLPNKLSQRFDSNETDVDGQPNIGDLTYLSTGSRGCYFAKFQSGECWWGSAMDDADFQNILNSWDVYRVAFGTIKTIDHGPLGQQASSEPPVSEKKRNHKVNHNATLTNSWIILSHDGKAAWKNLPSRLSSKLEMRVANSAAPVEVSLGLGDSYFVRFLDGSIDYSLPSKIARVCERIEERGGTITNISLHPDISHDFIIRHTELTR